MGGKSVAVVIIVVLVVDNQGILQQKVVTLMEITCFCAGWICCRRCMKLQSLDKRLQSVGDGGDHSLKRVVIARKRDVSSHLRDECATLDHCRSMISRHQ